MVAEAVGSAVGVALEVGCGVVVASTATDGKANGVGEADAAALGVAAAVPPTSTVEGADDRVMTTTPTSRERARTAVPATAKRAFNRFSPKCRADLRLRRV